AAANAVVITDADGKVLWINPAFTRLTGYAMDEVWGNTPRILKSGRHTDAFYRNIWDTVLDGRTWHGEIYNRRKDGTVYVEEQIITPVQNSIGEITHFIGIKQDVTERKRREERLGFLATHDELTGLFNRRALNERLELLVERAQSQSAGSGALLTMDLDRFKLVNDTLGHPAGDQLLIAVAQLLRSTVRGSDFVARHGGDEFAVVLDDATVEDAEALAGRIQQLMGAAEFPIKGGVISSSVSIGVVPIDGLLSAHEVAELADSALNAAKDSGRGKTVVYRSHEKRHSISHAAAWAARIKDALKEDRLLLHFQPIVQLEGRQIAGYEALARLVAEDGSLIYPQDFLPAAETAGLMPSVDRWVISHVLDLAQANPDVLFFVNLSGHSLVDEGLLYYLQHRLESGHASPGQLVVEVTESVAIRDLVALQEWMVRLRSAGCQFALDDFGAGFSSFAYLRSLPADYVKIDGTYVRDLEDNAASRALVEAMVSAAHALGKVVIAEWIESENVAHELRQMGVALGQGFHLGRPSQSLPREGSR
ncbi:MAG TPA: EAL domain-containing protein, partial [Symbiobacteriaceae bacterium]|nr:EAL domain-containing protein [Symbiobacteriaceae bacterium]